MAARTALFSRHQPGGLFTVENLPEHPGNIFFVDSTCATGADSVGYGKNPDAPFLTLAYAFSSDVLTANHGDVVYVMPGHAETIAAAGSVTCDIAGVTVIGLGEGEDRPTFTIGTGTDTATFLVSALDVKLVNLIFHTGNDGNDVLLDINADGCVVERCEFRSDEALTYQADNYIDIGGAGANAADRCVVRNCKISSASAGAAAGINISQVADALVIENNWIEGDFSAAGIESAAIFTNALVKGNVVRNTNSGEHAIEFSDAATGFLVDNRMYGDTLGTILDPGSMMCCGNLETDAIDQAGVDSPRTSAGGFPADSITATVIATDAVDADALAADAVAEIADGIADEAVSGHVTAGTVGAMLQPLHSGTAQAGAAGTITLAAGASATNDLYDGAIVQIIAGTGVGQVRQITAYTGATKVADVTPNWATNPNATSVYVILPYGPVQAASMAAGAITAAAIATDAVDADALAADAVAEIADGVADEAVAGHVTAATVGAMLQPLHSGAAQAGAAGTIQLAATASATNDLYNGNVIQIIGGTGAGQTRLIYDYDGATTTASVVPNWTTNPAAASVYVIHPVGSVQVDRITAGLITAAAIATDAVDADALAADAVDEIVDEPLAAHHTQNTLGGAAASVEMCCEKTDGAVLGVADPLFTIAGGPIEILSITGIVTTNIGAGLSNCSLQLVVTEPAATFDMNAAPVDIDADAAGTSYRTINTTGVFTPVTAGVVLKANSFATNDTTYLAPIGSIQCLTSAARAGNIKWYLRYKPLSPNSVVTAAA